LRSASIIPIIPSSASAQVISTGLLRQNRLVSRADSLAPELVQRRLATKSSGVGKNIGHQGDALLRIAEGLEDTGEIAAWR